MTGFAHVAAKASRSLIIPVYLNEPNIPPLIAALGDLVRSLDGDLEVVFVVDGSPDGSGELLVRAQPDMSFATRIVFHSRNFGSFTAIRTGLEHASGEYFAVMAADLQEPPELIVRFFAALETGDCDIVFGQRVKRSDASRNCSGSGSGERSSPTNAARASSGSVHGMCRGACAT